MKTIRKMSKEDLEERQSALDYRRAHFKVWSERDGMCYFRHLKEFRLLVTHNGYQATAISILPEEIDEFISVLKEMKNRGKKHRPSKLNYITG